MKWSGWPLTLTIAVISIVISYVLFQLGIYLFFLPIIFLGHLQDFSDSAEANHIRTYVPTVDYLHQEISALDVVQDFKALLCDRA